MKSMNFRRHLPGIGTHNEQIYAVGGSNDAWEAQAVVEAYDPTTDRHVIEMDGYLYTHLS